MRTAPMAAAATPMKTNTGLIRIASACRAAMARLATAMGYAAGWGFILCAVLITADVVARNTIGISSQSTTELTGYMLALGLTWGLAHALAQRAHVRIDILINRLPLRLRLWLHLFSLALLGVFAAFLAYGAFSLVQESLLFGATDISLLRTPLAVPQGLWAAGLVVFLVFIMLMLIENTLLVLAGRGEEAESNLSTRTYTEEAEEALSALQDVRTADKAAGA